MTSEIIPIKEPRGLAGLAAKPAAVFLRDERAAERFFEFFTASIRNSKRSADLLSKLRGFSDCCALIGRQTNAGDGQTASLPLLLRGDARIVPLQNAPASATTSPSRRNSGHRGTGAEASTCG